MVFIGEKFFKHNNIDTRSSQEKSRTLPCRPFSLTTSFRAIATWKQATIIFKSNDPERTNQARRQVNFNNICSRLLNKNH